MKTETENLLPCPFCGCEPHRSNDLVYCRNTSCPILADPFSVEGWNTRQPDLDVLRKALEEARQEFYEVKQILEIRIEEGESVFGWLGKTDAQIESINKALASCGKDITEDRVRPKSESE